MTKDDLIELENFKPRFYKKYYVKLCFNFPTRPMNTCNEFTMICTKLLPSWYEVVRLNGKIERSKNPKCRFGDLDRIRELKQREQIIMSSYSVDNLINNFKYVIDLQLKKKIHYKVYRNKLQKLFINLEIINDFDYDNQKFN